MNIAAIGTYLPPWGSAAARIAGDDEDVVTMAVQAGRAALSGAGAGVRHVVLVTRELPLLEGGNGAALVAGLGLPAPTTVVEQVGGGPAVLDALVRGRAGDFGGRRRHAARAVVPRRRWSPSVTASHSTRWRGAPEPAGARSWR